ncbi:hypothetical protein [uncultured Methylobacterium sp.]
MRERFRRAKVDEIATVRRRDMHGIVGRLKDPCMRQLSDALRFFIAV